jgi:peptidoglycan/LPS O-acetylase OafA/YrhL
VPLFFVISGFCIHYSFLRSGEFNGRQFFWRRFWRIYPAYIVAVLIFSITKPAAIWPPMSSLQVVSHVLFFHNVTFETFFGINSSFWSIAVEVQLYLLFPVLLLMAAQSTTSDGSRRSAA